MVKDGYDWMGNVKVYKHFIFISAHFIIKGNAFYAYFLSFLSVSVHLVLWTRRRRKNEKKSIFFFVDALMVVLLRSFTTKMTLNLSINGMWKKLFYCRATACHLRKSGDSQQNATNINKICVGSAFFLFVASDRAINTKEIRSKF